MALTLYTVVAIGTTLRLWTVPPANVPGSAAVAGALPFNPGDGD